MDLTSHPVTAMNFTESHHGTSVLERLYEQLADSKFCDVILHIQDRTYSAHRCVLAGCSPHFENVFRESAVEKEHVEVNSQHIEVFESVFTYIYTGKIVIDIATVGEILRLANYFMLNKLKGYCNEYLQRSLQVHNVYMIKDLAEKWGLLTLSKTAHGFILANLLEVVEQNEILHFDEYKIEGLISNKSFPLMEELKVHVICRWVGEDIVKRHKMFQQLMGHIQWPRLNVQTLYNMMQTEKLFSESEWCMWHLLKLLEDRGLLLHVYTENLRYLERKVQQGQNIEEQLLQTLKLQEKQELNDLNVETQRNKEILQEESKLETIHVNKPTLTINTEDELPVDTGFSSDSDPIVSGNSTKEENNLDVLPDLPQPVPLESVDALKPVTEDDLVDSAMDTSAELNDSSFLHNRTSSTTEREKHKRKGRPVKLRIPKSRLKLPVVLPRKKGKLHTSSKDDKDNKKVIKKEKKKRGRPPKKSSLEQMEPEKKIVKIESHCKLLIDLGVEEEDDDDIPDDSDLDETYSPVKYDDKPPPLVEKPRRKRNSRRKKADSNLYVLTCEHCQFKTGDENMLIKHMHKAHQDGLSYSCSLCGFESKWNKQYYKHMKTHFTGPPFRCDYEGCDHVVERIQPLLYHRMRHTDERPFSCTVCNMKFRTKNNLATHMRCHTGEKPWECDVCSRSFATKGTLEQHSVTHSEIRPYLCDTCGFSTKYQSHLIAHKRIHTGDVFRCQYPNCKYYTPKRSQLACHMRSHMSIRQHICSVCSRAFVEKSHLVRHERIHLQDRPFKCTHCDYGSTRRDKLKEHVLKYHSENSSPKNQYRPRKARRPAFEAAAFPDYSSELATRVQSEYEGQMDKAVQQRNEIHAELQKAKKQKEWTANTSSSVVPSELTQLKNVMLSQGATQDNNMNNDIAVTSTTAAANNQPLPTTTTLNYPDNTNLPIGVIDPNNTNNILMGNHLAFTIDSRGGLGFVQQQGMQNMLNSVQQLNDSTQQQQQSAPVTTYNTTQSTQPNTDLSQLQNLMGGLFSGIANM